MTASWSEDAITVAGSWFGDKGSTLDLLDENQGIFITDDGTLYVADTRNNRIVILRPNSTTAIATIKSQEEPTTYAGYTNVFVTKSNMYILDMLTAQVRILRLNKSNTNMVDESLPNIVNIRSFGYLFVDGAGNLYVAEKSTSSILCFPPNSTLISSGITVAGNGTSGSQPSQLHEPKGIFVDDARSLYVADYRNHRIQKWLYGASFGETVVGDGTCGSDNRGQICRPTCVTVDSNGQIFTVDGASKRILRWKPGANNGECIAACSGLHDLQSSNVFSIHSIAFDSQGSLYASDQGNNRVQKFQILANPGKSMTRSDTQIFLAHR